MKKVLLLGAISPFCDLVKEICELNYSPIVCDYYEDAPAKKMGYPSYNVSTMDVDKVIELVRENEVDGIVSAFSDRNLIPALEVCLKENKKYYFSREIIDCLTNKNKMKKFFQDIGFPVIKYGIHQVSSIREEMAEYDFPVVTKPIDAYGSKGIFVCNNVDEVLAVTGRVTKESLNNTDRIIIEEFYKADEISISAWVKDKKAYITCIYDVIRTFGDDILLGAVSFPSKYTVKYLDKFEKLVNKAVSEIGITDGPVTLQCFIGPKGIKVSELLCRLAGGSPYLYPTYFGGPNVAKMMIQYYVGDEIEYGNLFDFVPKPEGDEVFYDIQVMVSCKGIIHHSEDVEAILKENPDISDLRIYYSDESELINASSSGVQFAKVIYKTTRDKDYNEIIDKVDSLIEVYDDFGKKVSFIRRPEVVNIVDAYDIDWEFIDEY